MTFVPVYGNTSSSPALPGGEPERIEFGYDARPASDGVHEVITSLQGVLYFRNLGNSAFADRHATRQLIAFSQGIGSSTAPGSGIARGTTVDRFSPDDLAAMQRMSGCRFEPAP